MIEQPTLVFPGTGSQYAGMIRQLHQDHPVVKETFEQASDVVGMDLAQLCLTGSTVKLSRTANMLLAIYTTSVAHYRVLSSLVGFKPQAMLGHSLGEYAALTCAGALSFAEGLRLVKIRSEIADRVAKETDSGTSIIKQTSLSVVQDACQQVATDHQQRVWLACANSDSQFLISGYTDSVMEAEQYILDHDSEAQIMPIASGAPYHSGLMKPYADSLRTALTECDLSLPGCEVISNVSGLPYTSTQQIIDGLTRQLYCTVNFKASIDYLKTRGAQPVIELGPQSVLKQLLLELDYPASVYAFDDAADRKQLIATSGIDAATAVDEKPVCVLSLALKHATTTRNHNGHDQQKNSEVSDQLTQLYAFVNGLKKTQTVPDCAAVVSIKGMLARLFAAKGLDPQDAEKRLSEIPAAPAMPVMAD